jgi:hypothetical protein
LRLLESGDQRLDAIRMAVGAAAGFLLQLLQQFQAVLRRGLGHAL